MIKQKNEYENEKEWDGEGVTLIPIYTIVEEELFPEDGVSYFADPETGYTYVQYCSKGKILRLRVRNREVIGAIMVDLL